MQVLKYIFGALIVIFFTVLIIKSVKSLIDTIIDRFKKKDKKPEGTEEDKPSDAVTFSVPDDEDELDK